MADYRQCVGVMIFNAEGKVLVGRRKNKRLTEHVAPDHEWQMPQGGIDEGEAPYTAALREMFEETNISSVKLLREAESWYAYDLPVDVLRKSWKGRYRGQNQRWFAFLFTGSEAEIDIHNPANGAHKPEFDDFRWEDIENLTDMIIPFKRHVYLQVVAEFRTLVAEIRSSPEAGPAA